MIQWTYAWADYDASSSKAIHEIGKHFTYAAFFQIGIMVVLFFDGVSAAAKKRLVGASARNARWPLERNYAAFLSHYKKVSLLLVYLKHPLPLRRRPYATRLLFRASSDRCTLFNVQ